MSVMVVIHGSPSERAKILAIIEPTLAKRCVSVVLGSGNGIDELHCGPVIDPIPVSVGAAKIGKDKTAKRLKKIVKLLEAMQGPKVGAASPDAVREFKQLAASVHEQAGKGGMTCVRDRAQVLLNRYAAFADERAPQVIRKGVEMARAIVQGADPAMFQMSHAYMRDYFFDGVEGVTRG